ncbi:hypothetical protein D9M71_828640 [compost metagenome]
MRHAVELFVGQANMEIQPQWAGGAGHDRVARATAVGTANQLADQPAIGDGGIAVFCAWRPPRCLGCQGIDHELPVIQGFSRQQLAYGR